MNTSNKKTRADRKKARNEMFATTAAARAEQERLHPIKSGAVKIMDYVPPTGHGK